MYPKFIRNASDLETTHEAVREGFLAQALTKTQKATPHIENAIEFRSALERVTDVTKLLELTSFRDQLLTAAGFSTQAKNHLSEAELSSALKRVFDSTFNQAGVQFREEILYRYLLTKGDTLGGSIRNVTGALAQAKVTKDILKALNGVGVKPDVQCAPEREKIRRISWTNRRLLFDVRPKLIDKSVDVILLDTTDSVGQTEAKLLENRAFYLACGELKGGIDPGGADEHWKTATKALDRIRKRFRRSCPPVFFIAAAIEASMAKEIFRELKNGRLAHAANLTVPQQVEDLAAWLVSL
ncbi:MAG TPA: AvaI/BsoBI family type II restriction endonuclease [Verrucomicrobiae bacterium]|jgi:type II restriction enzyme